MTCYGGTSMAKPPKSIQKGDFGVMNADDQELNGETLSGQFGLGQVIYQANPVAKHDQSPIKDPRKEIVDDMETQNDLPIEDQNQKIEPKVEIEADLPVPTTDTTRNSEVNEFEVTTTETSESRNHTNNEMSVADSNHTERNTSESEQPEETNYDNWFKSIPPRQAKAINAILTTHSIAEAARISNIPERTMWRWISQPGFQQALNEYRNQVKQMTCLEILRLLLPAIQAYADLLKNPAQPGAAVKERVAEKILKLGEKNIEPSEFE